jgi:AcrR family transcriptional regulator
MALSSDPRKRTGRRPGSTQTRGAVAAAARRLFAEAGYDRASFRAIATEAGVDPALVVHYFGSKEALFREVMELPPAVADAIANLADGPRSSVGRRLATAVIASFENPATRDIVLGRIRSASSHPDAAELVRQTVERDIVKLAGNLDVVQPELRASLAGSVIVGTAFARYIVGVEPLASLDAGALVDVLAPALQHVLTGPLGPFDVGPAG